MTVIMNKSNYVEKAQALLADTNTYQQMAIDPRPQNVDDTFVIIKRTKLEETHHLRNNVFAGIKFRRDEENNNQLLFLDVRVESMTNGEFQTSVYRKATHTNQILNFHSNHPNVHKQRCIKTQFKLATTHCNTPELCRKEDEHLYKIFAMSGYPCNFIH
eukprot:g39987.t1